MDTPKQIKDRSALIGEGFAKGVTKQVGLLLIGGTLVFGILTAITGGYAYDDTDHAELKVRSGLKIRVDYGTQCQYLETRKGSLYPRLDQNGQPICGTN